MIKDIKKIILPSMFIILSGCASKIPTMEELEPFQVGEIEYSKNDTSDGSIYNSGNNSLLIGVGKRYQVGDIINILMSE